MLIQSDVSNDVCQRCSLSPAHKRTQCPAKDAFCRKCKKNSHFLAVCPSWKVNAVVEDDTDYFLGALSSDENDSLHIDPWKTNVSINDNSVEFKLDTGADLLVAPDLIVLRLNATFKILRGHRQGLMGTSSVAGLHYLTEKLHLFSSSHL